VDQADPRAIAVVAPGRTGLWRRNASLLVLVVALPIGVASAGLIWLDVVRKLQKPEPVFIPKPPVVSGVVWSNRVFVDEAALKRWFAARHKSYASWERQHPAAAALLGTMSRSR
jgi:hypothetical protein